MPISHVEGDIRLTECDAILVPLNARGQTQVDPLETDLRDAFPVFFSEYRRLAVNHKLDTGVAWFFTDNQPMLVGAVVRQSANSPARWRFFEQALVQFRHDYLNYRIDSLALARFGDDIEWSNLIEIVRQNMTSLDIVVNIYKAHIAGQPSITVSE